MLLSFHCCVNVAVTQIQWILLPFDCFNCLTIVDVIVKQSNQLFECNAVQQQIKSTLKQTRRANLQAFARRLYSFSAPLQRCLDLAQEKGASNWLTALPIDDCTTQIRFLGCACPLVWPLKDIPYSCPCSQLSMLYHTQWVDFQPYVTMKWGA